MLALDPRWLAKAGAPHQIAGWTGLAGPYDFLLLKQGPARRTFGEVMNLAATQPINYVRPGRPAAFLAHGELDTLVAPRNAARLSASSPPCALETAGCASLRRP